MKILIWLLFSLQATTVMAQNCQAPSQGFLEIRFRETFHFNLAERELKEWMIHPKNYELRPNIKSIDQRIRYSGQRLEREELLSESQDMFEQAIQNTGRARDMDGFPARGTKSKVYGSQGALSLEVNHLEKEDLDFMPKELLDKLGPKMKVNYLYPNDKFEYHLTYDGKELPMEKAFLKIQKDMETARNRARFENNEDRRWYERTHGGEVSGSSSRQ